MSNPSFILALVGCLSFATFGATGDEAHAPAKQRSWRDTTWDDPYVADIADVDTYLRRKFRQDVTDPATGVGADALKKVLSGVVASGKASGESWWITKAKCFAAQVKEQSIDVSPLDWFPAIAVWDRWSRPITGVVKNRAKEVNAENLPASVLEEWKHGNADGTWNMWQDFDHSVPDWRVIMKLGFPGMKERLEKYAMKGDPFYEGLAITMDAMLAGIDRFIEQGKKRERETGNVSPERSEPRKRSLEGWERGRGSGEILTLSRTNTCVDLPRRPCGAVKSRTSSRKCLQTSIPRT